VEGYCAARALEEAMRILRKQLPDSARGPVVRLAGAEKALDLVRVGYRSRFPPIRVEAEGFGWFYLEAPEELVLRYLREQAYWGTEESRRRLILLLATLGPEMKLDELRRAAEREDKRIKDILEELLGLLHRRGLL